MQQIRVTARGADLLPIDTLLEFQGKLKKLTPKNKNKLRESILKFGFSAPIFVWENGGQCLILDGHQRLKVLLDLRVEGYDIPLLPVAYIEAADEKEAKQKLLHIASQYGDFDISGLEEFVEGFDLVADDFATMRLGSGEFDLSGLVVESETVGDDEVPELGEKAESKLGEIYELGPHRLMCGDSTKAEDVGRLMGGNKADIVFTDPPYGVAYTGGIQFKNGKAETKNREMIDGDDSDIYPQVIATLKEWANGPCYIWFAGTEAESLYSEAKKNGDIHALIIWVKNGGYGALNANYKQKHEPCLYWKPKGKTLNFVGNTTETTVWEFDKDGINKLHPTQKPVALSEKAIKNHSGDIVLDLFGGSGSTIIGAAKNNKKARVMELDPKYCDVIRRRWTKWALENGQEIGSGGLVPAEKAEPDF